MSHTPESAVGAKRNVELRTSSYQVGDVASIAWLSRGVPVYLNPSVY